MNTNKLKTFAKTARLILLKGVRQRLSYWGFDEHGNVVEEVTPIEGGYMFREEAYNDPTVYKKWANLKAAIKRHTFEDIVEEAAYTWFNRLIAIKILEKNGYIDPVYEYVSDELQDPIILQKARKGETVELRDDEKKLLNQYIVDSKDEEAFGLLIMAYCRNQKLLNRIFGRIDDYTVLLLPNNLLSGGGIVEHINTTEAISEEDYKQVELIGWLYQFYVSDRKNEVFAGFKRGKKARPEDIPAATQIFTPNWIVKYMVENTVGRVWLDLHPDSPIRDEMKYLVEPADKQNYKPEPIIKSVTELTLMDPASGSGHILVEGFDLLMKMYKEEGYSTKNAIESIIQNNLYGLEVDDRAVQLANFAVLLKAATYNGEIIKRDILPNIFSFPEQRNISNAELNLFLGRDGMIYVEKLKYELDILQRGKNLGSAIKVEIPTEMRDFIIDKYKHFDIQSKNNELNIADSAIWIKISRYIKIVILLTYKYVTLATNPPYMGRKSMNSELKDYLDDEYEISKSDTATVFIEVLSSMIIEKGRYAFITPPSWMFLITYKDLRRKIIKDYTIDSLLHLSRGVFGADFGSVATTVVKHSNHGRTGTYFKLVNRTFQEFYQWHLDRLFLKAKNNPNFKFAFLSYSKDDKEFNHSETGETILFNNVNQKEFLKIPGNPIAYWVSKQVTNLFSGNISVSEIAEPRQGMATADNNRFLRFWYEVDINNIGFGFNTAKKARDSKLKWFPYNKGGSLRKWYGNHELVVDWFNDGEEIKSFIPKSVIRNQKYYFKEGMTWNAISSSDFVARYTPAGFLFDSKGPVLFPKNPNDLEAIILYFNSIVANYFLKIVAPTMDFNQGPVGRIPFIYMENNKKRLDEFIEISKKDWDAHEISWDYKINELLNVKSDKKLRNSYNTYCEVWTDKFLLLHKKEVENNYDFIELYELHNELTPDVQMDNITILQDEIFIDEEEHIMFNKDEVIKQFISYSIGCMFGRYSIDKEGLILAKSGDTLEEYKKQIPNPNFVPDKNGIIPLMGGKSNFSDDVVIRFKQFLEITFSAETLTENMNFIQECLDMELEKFLTEKFWQYHCRMYRKKPIYWLFSSPSGAFKVLVYMHRMNKFTVQKIRNNYLLKHLAYLRSEIAKLEENESSLSKTEAKGLDRLRSDEIECREYDMLVRDYADKQIEFDLDDGVSVNYKKFEGIVAPIK
jgi:hypothetical protein